MDGVPIAKDNSPKYLRGALNVEVHFIKHIENNSKRALKKLRILKSHCVTNWRTNPKTLKKTYIALIRPNLEHAGPICAHASKIALKSLDKIQAQTAKIIPGAVS